MLLHRVRIGLGLEEDVMAPNPFATPCMRTPLPPVMGAQPVTPFPLAAAAVTPAHLVDQALEEANVAGEIESVKEEITEESQIAAAACDISLFDLAVVDTGVVELDSSSGSSSSSEGSSSSDDEAVVKRPDFHAFSEKVPDGVDFYKHRKSAIVHKVKAGDSIAACKANMTANFQLMPRQLNVRWPKCLKCFPKDRSRSRSIAELILSEVNIRKGKQ